MEGVWFAITQYSQGIKIGMRDQTMIKCFHERSTMIIE